MHAGRSHNIGRGLVRSLTGQFCIRRPIPTAGAVENVIVYKQTNKQTHTHTHPFNGPLSGTTRVGRYQKGKTNLDLLEQETVRGSDISWAVCTHARTHAHTHTHTHTCVENCTKTTHRETDSIQSALHSRQITTPAPHHSVFTDRMPFLPPNQQRQSTEGTSL